MMKLYKNILISTQHREYPPPNEFWIMTQQWNHLLFMHQPFPEDMIKALLPEGLELDTYEGRAWISIIPFKVTGMRMRYMPPPPFISSYLELNVRTYVKRQGIPGVYFFSLDAEKILTVLGARIVTLPYFHAQINMKREKDTFYFESIRKGNSEAIFKGSYHPISEPKHSLSYWLLERYALWTYKYDSLFRADIHHTQWKVQDAEAVIKNENMFPSLPDTNKMEKPIFHYAFSKRTLFWPIKMVE